MNTGTQSSKGKQIYFIQIMRIVGCFGVFTGHFWGIAMPSERSYSFLRFLRDGQLAKLPFSFLWQGDSDVIMFLVIGGFLITYSAVRETNDQFHFVKLIKNVYQSLFLQ